MAPPSPSPAPTPTPTPPEPPQAELPQEVEFLEDDLSVFDEVPELQVEDIPPPPEEPPVEDLSAWEEEPLESHDDLPETEEIEDLEKAESTVPQEPLLEGQPEKVQALIDYLGKLSQFLPPPVKEKLYDDNIPLKLEKIRLSLTPKDSEPPSFWPVKGEAPSVTKEKLKNILVKLKEKLNE